MAYLVYEHHCSEKQTNIVTTPIGFSNGFVRNPKNHETIFKQPRMPVYISEDMYRLDNIQKSLANETKFDWAMSYNSLELNRVNQSSNITTENLGSSEFREIGI